MTVCVCVWSISHLGAVRLVVSGFLEEEEEEEKSDLRPKTTVGNWFCLNHFRFQSKLFSH